MKLSSSDGRPHQLHMSKEGAYREGNRWRRRIAWRLMKTMGWTYQQIGEAFGVHRTTICQMFNSWEMRERRVLDPLPKRVHENRFGTVKRAKRVDDSVRAHTEKRVVQKPQASCATVHGVPVRRFEEGTAESMIQRAIEATGKTYELKLGQFKMKPYFVDDVPHSYGQIIKIVDAVRKSQGFPPLVPPQRWRNNNLL